MHKLLIATAAVAFATVGTAGAADLPMKAPPMVAAAPAMSWTGCWVSGGVGYGMWNQDHFTETDPGHIAFSSTTTDGGRGWLGRVGVGCDYQFPNSSFLIGLFGDYDWMSLKGSNQPQGILFAGNTTSGNEKESAAWAIGARLGYSPLAGLLTYVNGGWTETRFDRIDLFTTGLPQINTFTFFPETKYRGWFIGGGYEYALNWFPVRGLYWKTEYRYAEFRAQDLSATFDTGVPVGFAENAKKFTQTVTTSLVWRFNWGGPVYAKY
jgi:outer membrane immunogenic protein